MVKISELEKRVTAVEEARCAAMCNRDTKTLSRLLDDDVTYGHSSGDFQDKAAMLARLRNPKFSYLFFHVISRHVRRRAGVVFSTGKMYAETQQEGRPVRRRAMVFTAVYSDDKALKLLALHVNNIAA